MSFAIDIRILGLLSSRLCHDLAGPIGAVNNGLEMLAEEDSGMYDEALELAVSTARRVSDVVRFYRLAYGKDGDRVGTDYSELRDLTAALLSHTKIDLDWPVTSAPADAPHDLGKLLLNMIVIAKDSLSRGGKISVACSGESGGIDAVVSASGPGCELHEKSKPGLAEPVGLEDLEPQGGHSYFTKLLAQRLGGELSVSVPAAECLGIGVRLPT